MVELEGVEEVEGGGVEEEEGGGGGSRREGRVVELEGWWRK